MDRWKAEMERVREKRKIRREKSRRERVRRKKMQMREKVGKSRNTVFFQWFVAPEGRKVGSLKRRVRSQLARWEMKNCTPLWREVHFQVKMYKAHQLRTTFTSWDVEKVHAVVARSTFPSQNVQSTPFSDHFWRFRCRKSARRCGAKHISKWTCTKHTMYGPLLEVQNVEKVHAVVARSTFPSQNVQNTPCTDHFWRFRSRFAWQAQGIVDLVAFSTTTTTTLHYTPIHYTTLHYTTLHYTTLPSTTLHYTTLHYTTLHYTTLHYTTLHYLPLHYITLHYAPLHHTTLHYTTLHYTPLHYTSPTPTTTLHYTKFQYATLHYTTLHTTTLHYTTLHYTTLHYTTLHYTEWHCTTDRQVDR